MCNICNNVGKKVIEYLDIVKENSVRLYHDSFVRVICPIPCGSRVQASISYIIDNYILSREVVKRTSRTDCGSLFMRAQQHQLQHGNATTG